MLDNVIGYFLLTIRTLAVGGLTFVWSSNVFSQNTVGTILNDKDASYSGFTLIYPLMQSDVYLINNCGQVVHSWPDSSGFVPGNTVYLLENGDLLKTKKPVGIVPESFSNGGSGGIVELRSWENELKWSKTILDGTFRAHHDIELLPNGNVLIICWQRRTRSEFLSAGGDTTIFNRSEIWPDIIREYNPSLDSFVWVWDAWDHLVQDYDETKENFGDVTTSVGRIDLNYDLGGYGGRADWLHSNAIDYNADLDQILLSVAHFDEVWIIDHSTTTSEACGSTGGNSGHGGDLLYRWGNSRAYTKDDEDMATLRFQHDAQWVESTISGGVAKGQISLFNNRVSSTSSAICVLDPAVGSDGNYNLASGVHLPSEFAFCISSSDELEFQSSSMSSVQPLPNGNFLVCAAQRGKLLEINQADEVVWEYILPFRNGFPVEQGSSLNIGDNVMFRAIKYSSDLKLFEDKDVRPKYYLEIDPADDGCEDLVGASVEVEGKALVYPVPSAGILMVECSSKEAESIVVWSVDGRRLEIEVDLIDMHTYRIDLTQEPEGVYYLRIAGQDAYRVILY